MTLEDIRKNFEHRDYAHRVDFIDAYDFRDEHGAYYKTFIINATDVRDPLYLSELIDLAAWLSIFDIVLYQRYFDYLFDKRHYLVKLAALDYLIDCPAFYKDRKGEGRLVQFVKETRQPVVRNQAYLNLICLRPGSIYLNQLKASLEKTTDWRSIYRTINVIQNTRELTWCKKEMMSFLATLHDEKQFGAGVSEILNKTKVR